MAAAAGGLSLRKGGIDDKQSSSKTEPKGDCPAAMRGSAVGSIEVGY